MENAQHAVTQPLQIYSAWYCPFAQRAWMALLHKGLDFEYIEVDPYRESIWWLRISRNRAKVPVIDSTRILEYLEDRVPERNPLYPGDAKARAELRFWSDLAALSTLVRKHAQHATVPAHPDRSGPLPATPD